MQDGGRVQRSDRVRLRLEIDMSILYESAQRNPADSSGRAHRKATRDSPKAAIKTKDV
jgi:hypothetical protein